jgi:energy-coupling factor transporter ATP-binding protein EcfA2
MEPVSEDALKQPEAQVTAAVARIRAIGEAHGQARLDRVVLRWIGQRFLADRWAKLDQAGRSDEKIRLSRVFVDATREGAEVGARGFVATRLSERPRRLVNPMRGGEVAGQGEPFGAVWSENSEVVSRLRRLRREELENPFVQQERAPGTVLIGGPGQGKTTVAQVLCQMHRAWWLIAGDEEPRVAYVHEARAFREDVAALGFSPPSTIQLPLRIDLVRLVERMRRGGEAMIDVLRREIADGNDLTSDCLVKVLRAVPCLIVLDGLDEVPGLETRKDLQRAIEVFFDRSAGIEGALVVTTRPQGYVGEFGALDEWRIAPWTPSIARRYAERLLGERFASQPEELEASLERIDDALHNDGTARLMTTPLQVTMMTSLVRSIGTPPRERWKLFQEYWHLVFVREREKGRLTGGVLTKYERLVREVHQHIALLLHAMEERGRGSTLNREQLRAVVEAQTVRIDVPEAARESLVVQILAACTDRLVFIVQPEVGRFGFEVRSLREFFAAGALTDGTEEEIVSRLGEVARASDWRNVFVLAVGRVMQDLSERLQRRVTVELCRNLEERGPVIGTLASPGALLALDLLHDGAVLSIPKLARPLFTHALALLDLPWHASHARFLSACVDPDVIDATGSQGAVLKAIEERLEGGEASVTAWSVLRTLAEDGVEGAREIVRRHWPESFDGPVGAIDDSRDLKHAEGRDWWANFVLDRVERYTPQQVVARGALGMGLYRALAGKRLLQLVWMSGWRRNSIAINPEEGVPIGWVSMFEDERVPLPDALVERLAHRDAWRATIAYERFLREPSEAALADWLVAWAGERRTGGVAVRENAPWLLTECTLQATTPEDLDELAARAREGAFGDVEDWRAAEHRWTTRGITIDDVKARPESEAPGRSVATVGTPPFWSLPVSADRFSSEELTFLAAIVRELIRQLKDSPSESLRRVDCRNVHSIASQVWSHWGAHQVELSPGEVDLLIADGEMQPYLWEFIPHASDAAPEWRSWVDRHALAGHCNQWVGLPSDSLRRFGAWLLEWWNDPLRRPQVETLAATFVGRRDEVEGETHPVVEAVRTMNPLDFTTDEAAWSVFHSLGNDQAASADDLLEWWNQLRVRSDEGHLMHLWPFALSDQGQRRFAAIWGSLVARDEPARREMLDVIRTWQTRVWAALDDESRWRHLNLPLPSPRGLDAYVRPPEPPLATPTRIRLTNLRGLRAVEVDVTAPRAGEGALLVILGENGLGKTTLLRGMVFALVDPGVAGGFLSRSPAPYRARGCAEARCVVETTRGAYLAVIENGGGLERIASSSAPERTRPFVVAYGCRRGSALGSPLQPSEPSSADDVDNLFDRPVGLTHAEAWLARLKAASRTPGDAPWQIYERVREALKDVLPGVEDIDILEDGRVWVTFRDPVQGQVRWAALSDGYLTTAGWIIDLMARWIERQTHRLKLPVEPDFRETMTGYALVDEIDLHLHPAWQAVILQDVRRLFPRMHFIVTTHNPLTLTGARPGEIRVLARDTRTGEVTVEAPPFDPRLRTGSELYARFFNIKKLYPAELDQKLTRYRDLATDPTRSDEEDTEARSLLGELREEQIDPGFEPEPRGEPS